MLSETTCFSPSLAVNEFVGPTKRVVVGVAMHGFFAAGLLLLSLFAYLIRGWRFLQLCIGAPAILYFLLFL